METKESKIITIRPNTEKADFGLLVSGEVFISGNRSLFGTEVTLYSEGSEIQKYTCCPNGSFYFKLDYEKKYTIVASKTGFENKSIEFYTGLNGHDVKRRFYDFGVTLSPSVEYDHESSNHQPAAIIRFFEYTESFEHDQAYHEQRLNKMQHQNVA